MVAVFSRNRKSQRDDGSNEAGNLHFVMTGSGNECCSNEREKRKIKDSKEEGNNGHEHLNS